MELLNKGSDFPEFKLLGVDERPFTPADIRGPNGIVLAFVHGTWCPNCLHQLRRLNRVAAQLSTYGVGLACVSHDSVAAVSAYQRSAAPPLSYPLLADSQPSLALQFGVFDPEYEVPRPALFYAGPDNKIRFADVSADPYHALNLDRLLAFIEDGL
ncbi:MAG: peroxiredoxin family protein [Chloroflexi bacterium]|nr:peroxiredoxin family protein [Chloroflexota bacterium]MCI0575765.1 peroxiredoxin family protein [Chloroflexota bacterium]MCI0643628.1 peroxiredoxin family protein [Chloroflexota bacterium]MCI0729831.1 peroxiredoxin family protein [Chloroflexota bacterium]